MKTKNVNESYFYNCVGTKTEIKDFAKPITDMGFSTSEVLELLSFYLFYPAIRKDEKERCLSNLRLLADYGWKGNNLRTLESKLLEISSIGMFCFIRAKKIDDTLENMSLDGQSFCVDHPRAVIMQEYTTIVSEDGKAEIEPTETRMRCVLRHIRNSLAHNQTYYFSNENILIEDRNDDGKISARILMPKNALLKWIKIIKKE